MELQNMKIYALKRTLHLFQKSLVQKVIKKKEVHNSEFSTVVQCGFTVNSPKCQCDNDSHVTL